MSDIERSDEWTTMQAALAFDGFLDAAETERVTLWAAKEIESLRHQLARAASAERTRILKVAHKVLSAADYNALVKTLAGWPAPGRGK